MIKQVSKQHQILTDPEDLQTLRLAAEDLKIKLSTQTSAPVNLKLHSLKSATGKPVTYQDTITRKLFEDLNRDLFKKVLEPIDKVLEYRDLHKDEIDEIVLVGGSTRIPRVRELIEEYFGKAPNTAIDPELAVASGVSIQAGILGGMWPLTVSATELPTQVKKIQIK